MTELTTQLKLVPRKTVNELKDIIKKIEKGDYIHDQSTWGRPIRLTEEISPCGSAFCIFGWKVVRDQAKFEKKKIDAVIEDKFRSNFINSEGSYTSTLIRLSEGLANDRDVNISDYVQRVWGLTDHETYDLYCGDQTLDGIKDIVDKLDRGYRKDSADGWEKSIHAK